MKSLFFLPATFLVSVWADGNPGAEKKSFDIPEAAAGAALKEFGNQSGRRLIYAGAAVEGIKTNPVKGEFTASEALNRMIAGTGLIVNQDMQSGALAITRAPDPNVQRAAHRTASARPQPLNGESNASTARERTVELNPFVVTADEEKGYLASNALSATKTNTALRDVPINIAVITDDVLKDLNVLVPVDALQYSASVQVTENGNMVNQQNGLNFGGQVSIRGTGTFFNLRNGFRTYFSPSAISIQRIEVIKGPASVLFGITKPGGAVNYVTKIPMLGKTIGSAGFSYGSFDNTRTTVDVNKGDLLGSTLGVRLAASYADVNSPYQFSKGWELAYNPSMIYRPFPGTDIILEFDRIKRTRPTQRTPFFPRAVPGFAGSSVPNFIYPSSPDDPVALLNPQLAPGFTPWFNSRGYGENQTITADYLTLNISQRISSGLSINAQIQRNRHHSISPEGFSSTVEFSGTASNFPFPRISRQFQKTVSYNHIINLGFNALHQSAVSLPWLGEMRNRIVAGVQRMSENYQTHALMEFAPGTTTRIAYYIPFTTEAYTGWPVASPSGEVRRNPANSANEDNDFDLGFVTWAGEFCKSRVILNAGVTRTLFTQVRNAATGITTSARANSPLVGAIVRPVRALGLFIQAARSLNPNTSARDGFAQSLPPERGIGTEGGVKYDLFGGRLSGTLGVFHIQEINRSFMDPNAPKLDSFYLDAAGVSHPISGPNDSRFDPNLRGQIKGSLVAAGEATSDGFDTDLVFSVTRELQFMASYAYLDGYVSRDLNTSLATMVGRPLPNNYYHRAALLGKYRFRGERLKGLDVVLGANWRSEINVDLQNTGPASAGLISSPLIRRAKASWGGDMKIGYGRLLFGRQFRFALNIGNLFEAQQRVGWVPKPNGFADTPYYYKLPRTYTFTSTVIQ